MAIELEKNTKFGIFAKYHRIENISFSKKQSSSCIVVSLYISQDKSNMEPVETSVFHVMSKGTLNQEMGYEHLKTLPEFEGAKDC